MTEVKWRISPLHTHSLEKLFLDFQKVCARNFFLWLLCFVCICYIQLIIIGWHLKEKNFNKRTEKFFQRYARRSSVASLRWCEFIHRTKTECVNFQLNRLSLYIRVTIRYALKDLLMMFTIIPNASHQKLCDINRSIFPLISIKVLIETQLFRVFSKIFLLLSLCAYSIECAWWNYKTFSFFSISLSFKSQQIENQILFPLESADVKNGI